MSAGNAATEVEQSLAVPQDPAAAAFFDIDNTMMVGASIYHFAKGLAARDFFSWRDLASFAVRQARLRLRGESKGDLHTAQESTLAFVAGKKVCDIVAMSEEIYDEELADRIWSGTYALAQLHLDAGQRVWLVTATPQELAEIIARRLGLTGALGTVAETEDGVYTGRLVSEVLHGEAKARAVRDLAVQEGLDLARCSAYSDSINDMPLLSLVGRAVAVNPDSALRGEARGHGWEVRDFRRGRKAARIGFPAALGAGAIASGVAAGVAVRREQQRRAAEQAAAEAAAAAAAAAARSGSSWRPNLAWLVVVGDGLEAAGRQLDRLRELREREVRLPSIPLAERPRRAAAVPE
jgi:HAD superfamily hydrolase (TIGR01490 family)